MINLQIENNQDKSSVTHHTQLAITLLGWAVVLSVTLFSKWMELPSIIKILLICFIIMSLLISLILGLKPVVNQFHEYILSHQVKKQKRQLLLKMINLLQNAQLLFDPNRDSSLRNYLNLLSNGQIQDEIKHSKIKNLSDRLGIIADWNWSLITFNQLNIIPNVSFIKRIRGLIRLHIDTAEIVREFTLLNLQTDLTQSHYYTTHQKVKEKYNNHMNNVEQFLNEVNATIPEINQVSFYKF